MGGGPFTAPRASSDDDFSATEDEEEEPQTLYLSESTLADLRGIGCTDRQAATLVEHRPKQWAKVQDLTTKACVQKLLDKGVLLRRRVSAEPPQASSEYSKEYKKVKKDRTKSRELRSCGFIDGEMSTTQYRQKMTSLGFGVYANQDVHHIIAKAKGGADHSLNYLPFGLGSSFNRSIGNMSGPILSYFAGIKRAEDAVKVSRKFGSYDGPSASKLFSQGAEFFAAANYKKYARDHWGKQ